MVLSLLTKCELDESKEIETGHLVLINFLKKAFCPASWKGSVGMFFDKWSQ